MPAAAVPLSSVSVELLPAVTEVGLNVAVAPPGTPETVRATPCADPLVTAVEIVELPLAPDGTVTVFGLAVIEKSFDAQLGNLNEPILVLQLNAPVAGMYSLV